MEIAGACFPDSGLVFENMYRLDPPVETLCITVDEPHEFQRRTISHGQIINIDHDYRAYVFRGYADDCDGERKFDFLIRNDPHGSSLHHFGRPILVLIKNPRLNI